MPSVVQPCMCSITPTRHICVLDEGSFCSSFSLLLHAFASLTVTHCCLESKITGAGVSPDSLINAPLGDVGSVPRTDLACRLRRSWRLSRLLTSLGCHQSSLPYSATTWTQGTWTALTLYGTTLYVSVRVRSLASAALAFFMHRLWSSLNIKCGSIQTPSQRVACLLNGMNLFPTFIFAVSFGRRCFLWSSLCVNSAASVFAISNCSPCLLAQLMLFAAHLSSVVMTRLWLLPVATEPWS